MPHHGITSFVNGGRVTEPKPDPCRCSIMLFGLLSVQESGFLLCFGVVSLLNNKEMIVNAVAVLIGDYSIYRKKAATLILKALLPSEIYKAILSDGEVYPFDRDDSRVTAWKKAVLAPGRCAFCGAEKDLEAHHVIGWAEWPQGRIDVSNGLCLCHKCHTEEHRFSPAYHMMLARGG